MIRQPYMWDEIEYLEKPMTLDEKEIDAVLRMALSATVSHDIQCLGEAFFEDASIVLSSKSGASITKSEYLGKMATLFDSIKNLKYRDMLVRVHDNDTATVSCVRYVRFRDFREELANRFFEFEKRDGIWKIAKVVYY